jgi:hypothetical protein
MASDWSGIALAQGLAGKIGGWGATLAGSADEPIQKGNVAAHKGLFWRTRLNAINQLTLTSP